MNRLQVFSDIIAKQISIGNYLSVESIAHALVQDPNLKFVRIYTHDNLQIAHAGDPEFERGMTTITRALGSGDEGTAFEFMEAHLIPAPFVWRYIKRLWPLLLIAFGVVSLLGVWFYSLIKQNIIKPLSQLQSNADHFELGMRMQPIIGAKEIESLSASLNSMAKKIAEKSIRDPLTHLYNRAYLEHTLKYWPNTEAAQREGEQTRLTAIFIDVDHFKHINDTFGHMVGDQVLVEISQFLQRIGHKGWRVYRFGGDEFVILLEHLFQPQVQQALQKILSISRSPIDLSGKKLNITLSLGACTYPTECPDLDTLVRSADTALYEAKHQGRNHAVVFEKHLQKNTEDWMNTSHALNNPTHRETLRHAIQPIVHAQSERIFAVELLLRFTDEQGNHIHPERVIDVARSFSMCNEISRLTFRNLRHCQQALQQDYRAALPKFFINLTRSQMLGLDLSSTLEHLTAHKTLGMSTNECNRLIRALVQQGFAQQVVFEITESEYLEDPHLIEQLRALVKAGFSIALDDFGSGYASLTALSALPLSYVKLDKQLTKRITEDASAYQLLKGISSLAHRLGIKIIAEGVESEAQKALLKKASCHYLQGFAICQPVILPAEEVRHWVWESRWDSACDWRAPMPR